MADSESPGPQTLAVLIARRTLTPTPLFPYPVEPGEGRCGAGRSSILLSFQTHSQRGAEGGIGRLVWELCRVGSHGMGLADEPASGAIDGMEGIALDDDG